MFNSVNKNKKMARVNQEEPQVIDLGRPVKCVAASKLAETKNYMVEKTIIPSFRR